MVADLVVVLRTRQRTVIRALQARDSRTSTQDEAGIFAALRQWKNEFR